MTSSELSLQNFRWLLVAALPLLGLFLLLDLALIPEKVKYYYLISRVGIQIPAIIFSLILTFRSWFDVYRHLIIFSILVLITYSNFWLIYICWQEAQFAFPYEGTLLYAFFGFFVLRMAIRFSIIYSILSLLGFAALVISHPIYGALGLTNLGFVFATLALCLFGLYSMEQSFARARSLANELLSLSRIDQLTGLYNRRAYEEEAERLLEQAQRTQTPISIFLVDLDHFKSYNDTYGHPQGDEAIKVQSDILQQVFKREIDIIGRYGGEEFIVIAFNLAKDKAQVLAATVLSEWKIKNLHHGKSDAAIHVSCSIGIESLVPNANDQMKHLIRRADKALYKAKDKGRNRFEVYSQ